MPMTFEQILAITKSGTNEDGFELKTTFEFWSRFRHNQVKWKSPKTDIPVLCHFVHEEKEVVINQNLTQPVLIPNKNIPVPTEEQKKAIIYLFENEFQQGKTITDFIFNEYNKLREYYEEPADSHFMPKLNNGMELTEQIELTQVFILSTSCQGISLTGFYFACGWDEEHGIGLLTHKDRVLQFGQIDEARDEYFKI